MAGDWIKMRSNLWDDPRVSNLCDKTGSSEASIIGGLYWLWSTADQHTEDGLMPGLTLRSIDRKTAITGFGESLVSIGWISEATDGIVIVRFDEHNGTSAKRRCTEAQRKANSRKLSAYDADTTPTETRQERTHCVAREREREREDISKPKGLDSVLPKKGTQLPDGFKPNDTGTRYAEDRNIDTEVEIESFCNWHKAKGSLMKDWQAAWRTWCDKAQKFQGKGGKVASESFFERDQRSKADRISQFTGQAPRPAGNVIDVTPSAKLIGDAK